MITSAILPKPLARLPWRLIFLVAGIALFGLVVLYSAAGGSIHPWAVKQAIVFIFFLGLAVAMSWLSEGTIKAIAFPLYGLTLVMLIGVEACFSTASVFLSSAERWMSVSAAQASCMGC
jgi:rod shape determining protein RodA